MPDIEPSATYRLQLHAGFDFAEAAKVCEYLAALGVSHLYLSPILQAAPGSMHGYDVVDHSRVSADLGGRSGLEHLAATAHDHRLGLIVDVVPNHMAIPAPAYLNDVWWEVLRDGRAAARSHWFDIDWEFGDGRVGLPILGDSLAAVLEREELSLEQSDRGRMLRYFDHVLPVAPGTGEGEVSDVLARQHYWLDSWKRKDAVLNYRRFFDVDTLVAVRVELPEVFAATHEVLFDLHRRGVIDGFRIDHPDGLADPAGYLEMLRDATDGAWVVVEKILAPDELLPTSWATAGTTGYDAIRVLDTAMSPPTGAELDVLWRDRLGAELAQVEERSKREILHDLFTPEIQRLARRAEGALASSDVLAEPDFVRLAIAELLVHVQTYRAYIRLDAPVPAEARHRLHLLRDEAAATRPALDGVLEVIERLLLDSESADPDVRDLVVRFQQVCGPVMAKGIEDTTFYRFNRFIALNEVGGDPDTLMSPSVDALHEWSATQASMHPRGMTTLSTHDTKRDEDVRARLLAAGEDIETWTDLWSRVHVLAERLGVDPPTAYFVFQTVLGAWPISAERLDGYLVKAGREAKRGTTWYQPDETYESNLMHLGAACRSDSLADDLRAWVARLQPAESAINLALKLLQLTIPGVPDVYQGSEQTSYSLVDPDNRRPVDFDRRAKRLAELDAGASRVGLDDDKLWVTSRALRLRRSFPDAFGAEATYRPIRLSTPHAIGFVRAEQVITLVTRWPGGLARHGWQSAVVDLPTGSWIDVLTETEYAGETALSDLLGQLPVSLLRRQP